MVTAPRRTSVSLLCCVAFLLSLAGSAAFWIFAFYLNGLDRFSYDDIYWQRTAGAGDFPFSSPAFENPLGHIAITAALLLAILGRLLIPPVALLAARLLARQWPHLTRPVRWIAVGSIALALAVSLVLWTGLGNVVYIWLMD